MMMKDNGAFMWSNLAVTSVAIYDKVESIKDMSVYLKRAALHTKQQAARYMVFALCEHYGVDYDFSNDDAKVLTHKLSNSDAGSVPELELLINVDDDDWDIDAIGVYELPTCAAETASLFHEATVAALQYLATKLNTEDIPTTEVIAHNRMVYRM